MSQLVPNPQDLGLPPKFSSWRAKQDDAILACIDRPERFVALALPTGSGKSAVYVSQAVLTDKRTCILTSTKGLQTQLTDDFNTTGMLDVRGQNSYDCILIDPSDNRGKTVAVDHGPCHFGHRCKFKENGCTYFDAVAAARKAKLVVTNYSFWMSIHAFSEGLGKFDVLVCDEVHAADSEVASF
ncbi:MAG: DEAD/DEAH box helicase family protein, partial [Candidatus Binatia bacterium]